MSVAQADGAERAIVIIVAREEIGWSAGSPHLGIDFVVLARTRHEVVAEIRRLLMPLVAHGLRYRFMDSRIEHGPTAH